MATPFEKIATRLDYPMFIVTAAADDEVSGCLVGFTSQCSVHPPRFMVFISKKNHTYGVAAKATHLTVHIAPDDRMDLAELFGGETGDEIDKFERVAWRPGPGGAPVLEDCSTWFAGKILERSDVGDHTAFLLEPVETHENEDRPMRVQVVMERVDPGHEP